MKIDNYRIKSCLQTGFLYLLHLLPIKKNKILFQSYYGEAYNDNPRFISEKLMDKGLELVWAVTKSLDCPEDIKQVNTSSFRYLYDLATSKVWVDNCRKRTWVRKKKGQYYIQTWHGNLGNKRIEGAAIDTLTPEYIARAKRDAGMIDLMISGSQFFTDLIRQYFWYDGEILECGTPRLDEFYHPDPERNRIVRERLNIPDGVKVVLYAPTFRKNLEISNYIMNYEKILEAFEKKSAKPWVMLVRLHPNMADKASFITFSSKVINATMYPDLYELIPLSDAIISDYSSLTYEAGLIGKPVFLFTPDLDEYIQERGFYIDIREQPFIIALSNEELVEKIFQFDKEKYTEELEKFNNTLGIVEKGNAADIIADRILKEIKK